MQANYESYRAEQFLEDPFFVEWIKYKTPSTEKFWKEWMGSSPANLKDMLDARAELETILSAARIKTEEGRAEIVWVRIENSLQKENVVQAKVKSIKAKQTGYFKWIAAAVILFIVAGLWLFMNRNETRRTPIETASNKPKDVTPGGDKAILTLADGRKVVLDTANNGAISSEGGVTVIKLNGQLAYNKESLPSAKEVLYNTITTPRGGQYQLILADGTKVWLNAASSLRFPTAFLESERKVELTGEGYFEVSHDAKKPFHVLANDMDVEVLGTHFNINSYGDEPLIRTTLLEGRVLVKKEDKFIYLNPGQQAVLQPDINKLRVVDDVDIEEVVAWKNGMFAFNNTPLSIIMRQIERWYNVNVVYQGSVPQDSFNGSISRNTNLSEVLKVLEYSKIRFKLEGNTITVLSQ